MGIKVANNAFATLAAGISNSETSITVSTGQGARFPVLSAGDYFYATLINTSNQLEIVKCTARSGDVLTVVRAQEATAARAYDVGDRIEIRITAQTFVDATTIENESITAQLIAPDAVTTAKILNGAVTDAKIAAMAAAKLTGRVPDANAPLGSVIQVVSVTKTNTFTTTSTSFVDITGLSATITPLSSTSKILASVTLTGGGQANQYGQGRIVRGSTPIAIGDSDGGNRTEATFMLGSENTPSAAAKLMCFGMNTLDSPATTSAVTYKVQARMDNIAGALLTINMPGDTGTNLSYITRGVSSITLMEIAA